MSMTTTFPELSTNEDLRARFHVHTIDASKVKKGIIDVDLLKAGLRHVPACLDECAVVGVRFAARTKNNLTQRYEEVFATYDAKGNFICHYFSGVFKALMT